MIELHACNSIIQSHSYWQSLVIVVCISITLPTCTNVGYLPVTIIPQIIYVGPQLAILYLP